jgi:GTP-binding protein
MQDFLLSGKLDLIIQLVDIRHDPTEDDMMMVNFLYHYRLPFIIVATKADKVAKTKIKPRLMDIASKLKVGFSDVTATSAEKNIGKTELLDLIEKFIKGTNENV